MDLAGPDKGPSGKLKEDAKAVMKPLQALASCITTLADKKPGAHIPYRESKLTRVLEHGLSGNSLTTLIGCVSPSATRYDETRSTLLLLSTARKIVTFPVANEDVKVAKKGLESSGDGSKSSIDSGHMHRSAKTAKQPANPEDPSKPPKDAKGSPERRPPEPAEDSNEGPSILFIAQRKAQAAATPIKAPSTPDDRTRPSRGKQGPKEKEKEPMMKAHSQINQERLVTETGTPRIEVANKIIRRLAHSIRYLQSEVTKKVHTCWLIARRT